MWISKLSFIFKNGFYILLFEYCGVDEFSKRRCGHHCLSGPSGTDQSVKCFPVVKAHKTVTKAHVVLFTLSGPVHQDHFPLAAVCGWIPECLLAGQGDGDESGLSWLHSKSGYQQQSYWHPTLAPGQSSEWSRHRWGSVCAISVTAASGNPCYP